ECTELVDKSIDQIIGQLSELIAVCPANSNDSEELARSIFYATERFHHPAHANEWKRETIEQEFNIVWNLIEKGFLK
ncbi:TetR/AcrR family transcriptional regulator, partial [Bacillus sp. IG2]|nr:TetR/AcrR family transcriptional regulator [Bacillus sp. IG2]